MLARRNRLTHGTDYKAVVRRGRRCAAPLTVGYIRTSAQESAPRFGFIVSRQVGSAVVRNTVRRRLKAACGELLNVSPNGTDIVFRALPGAANASFHQLRAEVARCLARTAP